MTEVVHPPAPIASEPAAWTTTTNLRMLTAKPRVSSSMWGEKNGLINVPLYTHPAPAPAVEGLVEFAKTMIRLSWEGCDADGGLVQETAHKCGLLEQTVFDAKKHKDPQGFAEDGDWWYMFAGPLAAAPTPQTEGGDR